MNIDKLIKVWITAQEVDVDSDAYDKVSWAIDELYNLAHDDPDKLLNIIIEILNISSSDKVIGAIGAGALEELLVHHSEKYVDKILKLSDSNDNFKKCLTVTYLDKNDVSERVYKKIQSAVKDSSRK